MPDYIDPIDIKYVDTYQHDKSGMNPHRLP